jgi:hypothetical protein
MATVAKRNDGGITTRRRFARHDPFVDVGCLVLTRLFYSSVHVYRYPMIQDAKRDRSILQLELRSRNSASIGNLHHHGSRGSSSVPRLAFSWRHHTDNLHPEREFPLELRSYDPIPRPYSKSRASSFHLLFLKDDLASTLRGSWLPSHVKAEERF